MDKLKKSTLILADDHPLFMKGLITALQEEFLILAVAANGKELLDILKTHQPEAILLDLQMPYMDGLCAAKQIAIHYPQIKLIILSAFYENEIEDQLKMAGVKGYLTKDIERDFLICQIKLVLADEIVFCEPKEEVHFNILFPSNNYSINQYKLSARELEIMSFIRKGLTSNEIAKTLFISINTVEAHRKHIFKKLKLKNIQGLVEFAYKYSL
jgi:two-component system nitrate/nitrite response regulator NarL